MQGLSYALQEVDRLAHSLNGGLPGFSSIRFHNVAEQNDNYDIHGVMATPNTQNMHTNFTTSCSLMYL